MKLKDQNRQRKAKIYKDLTSLELSVLIVLTIPPTKELIIYSTGVKLQARGPNLARHRQLCGPLNCGGPYK